MVDAVLTPEEFNTNDRITYTGAYVSAMPSEEVFDVNGEYKSYAPVEQEVTFVFE